MKVKLCCIFWLMSASALLAQVNYASCRTPIVEYQKKINEVMNGTKFKGYFKFTVDIQYNNLEVMDEEFEVIKPTHTLFELKIDEEKMEYNSAQFNIFKDKLHYITIIHASKSVNIAKSPTSKNYKKIGERHLEIRDSLLLKCTIGSCFTEKNTLGQEVMTTEFIVPYPLSVNAQISKITYKYNNATKQIQQIKVLHLNHPTYSSITTTYHTINLKPRLSLTNNVLKLVVDSKNRLLKKYASYTLNTYAK